MISLKITNKKVNLHSDTVNVNRNQVENTAGSSTAETLQLEMWVMTLF